jgi:hypothetical protein
VPIEKQDVGTSISLSFVPMFSEKIQVTGTPIDTVLHVSDNYSFREQFVTWKQEALHSHQLMQRWPKVSHSRQLRQIIRQLILTRKTKIARSKHSNNQN